MQVVVQEIPFRVEKLDIFKRCTNLCYNFKVFWGFFLLFKLILYLQNLQTKSLNALIK